MMHWMLAAVLWSAGLPDVLRVVPGDAWAIAALQPAPDETSTLFAAVRFAAGLRASGSLGTVSPEEGVLLKALDAVAVLRRYPRVYLLNELRFQSVGGDSQRLVALRGAVVVDDGGHHEELERLIQEALLQLTSTATASLERYEIAGQPAHRLIDQRLPDWVVLEWGAVGQHYAMAVGRGELAALAGASVASVAPWWAAAYQAVEGPPSGLAVAIELDRLRAGVGPARARCDALLGAVGLDRASGWVWAFRRTEDTMHSRSARCRGSAVETMVLFEPVPVAQRDRIPPDARWSAHIPLPAAQVLRGVRDLYLQFHGASTRRFLEDKWAEIARTLDVDVDRDLFDALGPGLIVHDAPPHPMGLPVLATLRIPVVGDSARVRRTLDRIFDAFAADLARYHDQRPSAWNVRLEHTPEGWWSSQWVIYGPALAVTDDALLISYSLPALRRVTAHEAAIRKAPSREGPPPVAQ